MKRSIFRRSVYLALVCLGLLSLAASERAAPSARLLFVYGSLKQGEYNHGRLADQVFVGEGYVRDYALFVAHPYYPYAAPKEGARIWGEVYEVDAATAALIDRFEASDGYWPEPVWVRLTTGQRIVAEIYVVSPERIAELGAERYPSSRWHGPDAAPDEADEAGQHQTEGAEPAT